MPMLESKQGILNILIYFFGYVFFTPVAFHILINCVFDIPKYVSVWICEGILISLLIYLNREFLLHEFKCFFKLLKFNISCIISYEAWIYITNFVCNIFIYALFNNTSSANQGAIQASLSQYFWYTVFSAVIFAPFAEELVFRTSIFSIFYKKYKVLALFLASAVFGFLHVVVSLFSSNPSDLIHIIPYTLIGYCICLCYIKSNNFITVWLLHLLNNCIGLISMMVLL